MIDGFYIAITTKDSMEPKNDLLHISNMKSDEILLEMKPQVQNGANSNSKVSGVKDDGNE